MITRSISKAISRGIALAINYPNGAGFDPLSLFAAGEQGAWYDPSDFSTLFQDAAGTIPVTAAGQPVGMMRDKSGRGNHATQATATSRPILQTAGGKWYLAFDGVDDFLVTGNINLTSTSKVTAWSGVFKSAASVFSIACEFSADVSANNGAFRMGIDATNYSATSRGTTVATQTRNGFNAPHTAVLCLKGDITAPAVEVRVNTSAITPTTSTQGTGNYGTFPLYIGRRGGGSAPLNGNLYSLIVRGAASTAQQITDTENYINSKTGAY